MSDNHPFEFTRLDVDYQRIAEKDGVKLPPFAHQPKRWLAPFRFPATPPLELGTTPGRVLRQIVLQRWPILLVYVLTTTASVLSMAVMPGALGNLLDSGLERGLGAHLVPGLVYLLILTAISAIASGAEQIFGMVIYMSAELGTSRAIAKRTADNGVNITNEIPSGDVVAAVTSDAEYIGGFTELIASVVGAISTTVVITILMLQLSVPLGMSVIIGLPLLTLAIALLVKPMQARQNVQREAVGKLTSITTDAVAGLRVLRGIGGEDEFSARYLAQSNRVRDLGIRVAPYQGLLNSIRAAAPAIFATVVVAVAATMVYDGSLTVGQMVSFYGYTLFLASPLWALTTSIQFGTRAWVGAKKLGRIFNVPSSANASGVGEELDWAAMNLSDPDSGVELSAGQLTGLVCADPDVSAQIARRFNRSDDTHPVRYGKLDSRQADLLTVRQRVVVSDSDNELFTGTLRANLLGASAPVARPRDSKEIITRYLVQEHSREEVWFPRPHERDRQLLKALEVADGADILSSLPGGLDGTIAERGRSLSGGQRQRVSLARAVAAEPAVLICIEPTSAVDSHTESRIAKRLATYRRGRTTAVVTSSPLVLENCDRVVLISRAGKLLAAGTHKELLAEAETGQAAAKQYRDIISRATGEEE